MFDLIDYIDYKPLSELCLRNIKDAKIITINQLTYYFCVAYELPDGEIVVKKYNSDGSWWENPESGEESDFDIVLKEDLLVLDLDNSG